MNSSKPRSLWLLLLTLLSLTTSLAQAETATNATSSILKTSQEIHVPMGILAVIAIVVGLLVCLAGYRLFRVAIFFCGFVVGGLAVASIAEVLFKHESWLTTASWVGFVVGGVLVGIFAISLYKTSVFIAGGAAGVLLAFTLHTSVTYRVAPGHPNDVLIVLAVVLGIVGGLLALWIERPVIIIATSFAGAVVTIWGIGYYAGDFPNAADLAPFRHETIDKKWVYSIPHAWWAYLAGIVVIFAFGMMFQFRKTSRNYHYKSQAQASQASAAIGSDYDQAGTPQEHPRSNNPISYV